VIPSPRQFRAPPTSGIRTFLRFAESHRFSQSSLNRVQYNTRIVARCRSAEHIPPSRKARYRFPTMRPASHEIHRRRILLVASLLAGLGVALPLGSAQAASAKMAAKGADAEAGEASEPAPAISPPPPGSSPMADLKKSNAALKKLFQKEPPSWSPEHDAKQPEMRKIMSGFLDFEELSHRILARHWHGLKPKQRTEFVGVLRDLIERNYINRVRGQPNSELRFHKESITGSEATVSATLDASNGGKKVGEEVESKLLFKGSRWLAHDVVTDEQSMLETYQAEFNKIIVKESFDALLKRMRKKLDRAE